ncbi:MAG TPA: ribosome small subunit-dependent GTPase A [Candidatus Dormibacteraeota bacterium]
MSHDLRRLTALGWNGTLESAFADAATRDGLRGLVSRVDGRFVTVVTEDGAVRVPLAPTLEGAPDEGGVTTGDWLVIDDGIAVRLLPRRSVLMRRAAGVATVGQAVAANIDLVFITVALGATVKIRRIERSLAMAWSSGATPVVLLTKSDLSSDLNGDLRAARSVAAGSEVVAVNASGEGVEHVRELLPRGAVAVLVGPSGTGKSTLVNRLVGTDVLATGKVRADGKGRHTTTRRELIELPGGGLIIDTPGTRELGLWDAGAGIEEVFGDLTDVAATCRFRNCMHESEPGCAVRAAAADDPTVLARLESKRKLEREQERLDAARDLRALAERHRAVRKRARAIKQRDSS